MKRETYCIQRACNACGHSQETRISKRDAAFGLCSSKQLFGEQCTHCGCGEFSGYEEKPDLDIELLQEWAHDEKLHVDAQDESIILASEKYIPFIIHILDTQDLPLIKQNILMEALCVIVYDNMIEEDGYINNISLKESVIQEIQKRKEKLQIADTFISEYIKDVVYPELHL